MPRFSIIVVYYQGVHDDETFRRGLGTVSSQTFKDFEVLIYHDGPLLRPVPEVDGAVPPVRCTETRFNDWGHSLRDQGIKEATGEYVLFFNADNLLYPQCLESLHNELNRPYRHREKGKILDSNHIIIFPIVYRDVFLHLTLAKRFPAGSGEAIIMIGNPPLFGQIDCMQFVMKRQLWLLEGGWKDKRETSDGYMYPAFCEKYGYRTVCTVLGEHL